eukprot:CAMPEP_0185853630 /NCGR_PEP_ID=MMETSP1354-20130828/19687_1 /TAXON_ID=708628 /ORGANISM="Erythrolobus madagascarensis, Strain CCMP3276" /LENGTH=218 /DNA_ID=CAMNT_0028555169 /DNA_START=241 /DNA_END=897 /DNA_ORIENTATION=+
MKPTELRKAALLSAFCQLCCCFVVTFTVLSPDALSDYAAATASTKFLPSRSSASMEEVPQLYLRNLLFVRSLHAIEDQVPLFYTPTAKLYVSFYMLWAVSILAVWRIVADSLPTTQPYEHKYERVAFSSSSSTIADGKRGWRVPQVWRDSITAMMMWAPFQVPFIPMSTLKHLLTNSDHDVHDDHLKPCVFPAEFGSNPNHDEDGGYAESFSSLNSIV